ncbi:hypothetical protein MJI95_31600, partial [Salmonella enterica subsp. enterica serovar Kentucky]|nr:hypothetical protein [Salmonella enterica subsp. enterica serovar Kentucky]
RVENVMEEYHAIFAERMIQHPAVQRICNADYSALFKFKCSIFIRTSDGTLI